MILTISIVSLVISLLTFWFTRLYKGTIKMTRPTVICFLGANEGDNPKVFLRTLLYSTSESGKYLQNMFIKLQTPEITLHFNIWAYGDKGIVRGSGLFINKAGVAYYHHFLLPNDKAHFEFSPGNYKIEVFAEVVNKSPKKIFEHNLTLSQQETTDLLIGKAVYYDWVSDSKCYIAHSDIKKILEGNLQISPHNR